MKTTYGFAGGASHTSRFRRILPLCLAVSAAAWIGTTPALADPIVEFQLTGVTLADGGTATGTFDIDETTGSVTNGDIIVSDSNSPASPDVFDNSDVTSEFDAGGFTFAIFNGIGDGFGLTFEDEIEVGGPTSDPIVIGDGSGYSYNGGSSLVSAGEIDVVSSTPEPASLSLMLGGAMLMAGAMWYRRKGQLVLARSSSAGLN